MFAFQFGGELVSGEVFTSKLLFPSSLIGQLNVIFLQTEKELLGSMLVTGPEKNQAG